jgi:hypothetical protein
LRSVVVELKVLGSYKAAELARAETVQSIEGNL